MSCKACTEIPVIPSDYKEKGTWTTIANIKTYTYSTSQTPTKALIAIYDVFGLHPATIQGADILAQAIPDTLILLPDFFDGKPLDASLIPPDTDEKKATIGTFMAAQGNFEKNVGRVADVKGEAAAKYPSVKKWGAYGLCWGGKITALASGAGAAVGLDAAATAHPGRISVDDVKGMKVPYCALMSMGEQDGSKEEVAAYISALNAREGSHAEQFADMWHGWMGARANLDDEHARKEFQRGYGILADFFAKHL